MINIYAGGRRDPCYPLDAELRSALLSQVYGPWIFHSAVPLSDSLAPHLRRHSSPPPMASALDTRVVAEECSRSGRSGTERLWKEYFTDPSQWWDNRESKTSPRSPDFKHKITKELLWIDSWYNPGWVKDMLEKKAKASHLQDPGLVEERYKPGFSSGVKGCVSKAQDGTEKSDWEALSLQEALTSMERMSHPPSVQNLTCILHKCRTSKDLEFTKRLYAYMCKSGLEDHRSFGNYLVPMLVQVGSMDDAQQVFDKLTDRNVYSWTSLIVGYTECGKLQHALNFYQEMQEDSVLPNRYTFMAALKACARLKDAERGREIHAEIARNGLDTDLFVGSTLVDMYAKCGLLAKAQEAFDKLPGRNEVSWNALMAGYAEHGLGQKALNCFQQMQGVGLSPNAVTFVCSLKACGSIGAIDKGREIHADISKEGLERNPFVGSSLVDMYVKFGWLAEAREAFDKLPVRNEVSWTALMAGYSEHGLGEEALDCLEQMQLDGLSPNAVTFSCSLKACGSIGAIDKGREIHAEISRLGLERDLFVGSGLVDMYAKCGSLAAAQEAFDTLPVRNEVSWTALMTGYAEHGLGEEALNCLEQMQVEGYSPNGVTFSCSLKACGSLGAIDKGREVHAEIYRKGLEGEIFVGCTLVDMYAKCGSLAEAKEAFDELPVRNEVSWNALIAGYVQLGESEKVFHMLGSMRRDGIKPDGVTLSIILSVCSHTGLVDKGQKYFEAMVKDYDISPTVEHYTGIVDLFGRVGQVNEVIAMVKRMPFHPNLVVWHTVLATCRMWGDVELGRLAFEHAVQLDEKDGAAYVLMSNIYADARKNERTSMGEARTELVDGQWQNCALFFGGGYNTFG